MPKTNRAAGAGTPTTLRSSANRNYSIDASLLSQLASGQWVWILSILAPVLRLALQKVGKHVPCPVHGGKDGFRVFRDVNRTGGGICNSCGSFSDGLALLMWVNAWTFGQALRAVADVVGAATPQVDLQHAQRSASGTRRSAGVRDNLRRIWTEAVPVNNPDALPARTYLDGRGLRLQRFPSTLRFHAALPYFHERRHLGNFPALIALVQNSEGQVVSLHRTYLTQEGGKAPVSEPKKLMTAVHDGATVGAAIRLANPQHELIIAEGIETALAVSLATNIPAWATITAGGMETVVLPELVRTVIIAADNDRSGRGQQAARKAALRLIHTRSIKILMPPTVGTDWADVLQEK